MTTSYGATPPPTAPGAPARPVRPRSTSSTGPVLVTVLGLLLLLGALAAGVGTAVTFLGAVGTGVLTSDGGPGPEVLAAAEAPGATTVELTAGQRYAVHVVVPTGALRDGQDPTLSEDVLLLTPSGQVVTADGSPGVTSTSRRGGWATASVGAFTAPESGTYQVAAPPADVPGSWVALTPDTAFAPFFASVWGTVLGVLLVIGLGAAGCAATVGGAVWWVLRAKARRAAAAG